MLNIFLCFIRALFLGSFSFILVAPRLKILATYEAQQVPPEWSPKFLPADQLFCYTSLEYTHEKRVAVF